LPAVARDFFTYDGCGTPTHVNRVAVTTAQMETLTVPRELAVPSRTTELLLTGGGSLLLLPVCLLLQRVLGHDRAELAVGFITFYGAHAINDPHFAVTYLLFYRRFKARVLGTEVSRAQRFRYWFAGVIAPLGLMAWAVSALALRSADSLGRLTQLMFLLVGWHYVKQGFGVLLVLSARRGHSFSNTERRVLLAHCFAGWAYAWASPFDPGREVEEKGVVYTTWAHPHFLEPLTRGVFCVSALVLASVLAWKWWQVRKLPWAPLLGLLCSVWLWTVYSGLDPLFMYLIPALHSVQYLYIVWLRERGSAHAQEGPPAFGRPVQTVLGALAVGALVLGLILFHLLPSGLDAALVNARAARFTDLGPTPYFAAVFACVNLHHYFMDSVIWRREEPDSRYLLR